MSRASPATRARRKQARTKACPECGAGVGEHCIGRTGKGRLAPHRARMTGTSPAPKLHIVTAEPIATAINEEKEYQILRDTFFQISCMFEEGFRNTATGCESPIERLMLLGLLSDSQSGYPFQVESWWGGSPREIEKLPIWEQRGLWLIPQCIVGPYRVDLALVNNLWGDRQIILIECDGHDFHEKTKEQATRDKRRDRYFAAEGYTVLHFTGSEIYRDPLECAQEVLGHLK